MDDGSLNDFSTVFKSRKALNAVVMDYSEPASIINLKRVANILMLVLLAISFADYFVTINEYKGI